MLGVTKLDWSPYRERGARTRIHDQASFYEGVELELIAEGGQWAVRRTTWQNFKIVRQEETARGTARKARETWHWLTGRSV